MNTLKCSRFIYLAMRPLIKRMLFILVIPFIPIVTSAFSSNGMPAYAVVGVLLILLVLSMFLSIYTFYASDKIPQLFIVLPQQRVDFVRGIYLNYLFLISGTIVIDLLVFLIFRIKNNNDLGFPFLLGLIFFILVFITATVLPIAFKVGYAKLQTIFMAAMLAVSVLPTVLSKFLNEESILQWAEENASQLDNPTVILGFVLAAVAGLAASYQISKKVYNKRDI
ncbi:ABC-2 transporter permease [Cohnella zeiphila]|uniref:ABC-2 transporter permease n=1 Tax=Cohnella zeiphila TaxID=2761120 RepID=A0A7X0SL82_9BACL|nr:ABC-2 transporter permease [Cohnella zeiphila]MBB6732072.1 ABC-2 transporter permease [Cohnella zeiphila]